MTNEQPQKQQQHKIVYIAFALIAVFIHYLSKTTMTPEILTFCSMVYMTFYMSCIIGVIIHLATSGIPGMKPVHSLPKPWWKPVKDKVLVFTDKGVEDIDDEEALHYLLSCDVDLDLTIIFTGTENKTAMECLKDWTDKFQVDSEKKWNPCTICKLTTLDDIRHGIKVVTDYVLQIGPVTDYTAKNLTVNKKYFLAGNVDPKTKSFNMKGSHAIVNKFQNQGKLVEISSEHMAKMRFNSKLFDKFADMSSFADAIVFCAFQLAFSRIHHKHPAAKFISKGLVNPEEGRGANYKSVSLIYDILITKEFSELPWAPHPYLVADACKNASVKYFKDVYGEDYDAEDTELSEYYLTEINTYLTELVGRSGVSEFPGDRREWAKGILPPESSVMANIFYDHPEVFYSNFTIENIPEELESVWKVFKANKTALIEAYNPVYDLFAGFVLIGEIKGEDRTEYSPEDFIDTICEEF